MKNGDWRINRSPSQLPTGKRKLLKSLREKIFTALGDKCIKCGFNDKRALHVDHVKGTGSYERKKYSGLNLYYYILKNIESGDYQILCANCNYIKKIENKEYHRRYPEDHIFPTEKLHVPVFNYKKCINCLKEFLPKSGRQIKCSTVCIKG